jgi:ribosomal-protein-serine acetyltransferase
VIDSDAYSVRQFELSDAESFYSAVRESIDQLAYWMPWCSPDYSLQDAHAWMRFSRDAWAAGTEYPLGIFDNATGQVVGGTGINHIDTDFKIGNIGYWISSRHAGRGEARHRLYFQGSPHPALVYSLVPDDVARFDSQPRPCA